jgi:hypothetical protein
MNPNEAELWARVATIHNGGLLHPATAHEYLELLRAFVWEAALYASSADETHLHAALAVPLPIDAAVAAGGSRRPPRAWSAEQAGRVFSSAKGLEFVLQNLLDATIDRRAAEEARRDGEPAVARGNAAPADGEPSLEAATGTTDERGARGDRDDASPAVPVQLEATRAAAVSAESAESPGVADAVPPSQPRAHEQRSVPPARLVEHVIVEVPVPPPATFPLHIFGRQAEFLRQVADQCRVPVAVPAMQMLGMLSAVSQKRCCISIPEGYLTTGLYIMVSAESGDGKSRSQRVIASPLRGAQARAMSEAERAAIPIMTQRRILELQVRRHERQAARTEDAVERETLEHGINQAREALASLVTRRPRLFTGDVTMERLLTLMQENAQVMLFLSDEGSRLFEMMRYYEPILQAFNGQPIDQARMSRTDLILDEPSLAILVAVQPTILSRLVANPENVSRGLLARFLYLVGEENRQRRTGPSAWVDENLSDAYESRLLTLLGNPVLHGVGTRLGPVEFAVVGDALGAWEAFNDEIIDRSERGDLRPIHTWAIRAPENALKVAGILHAWEFADFSRAVGDISAETLSQAIELMRYLIPDARRAFSAEVLHFGEVAQKIFDWYRRSAPTRQEGGFGYEQMLRAFGGRHHTVEVRAGINALVVDGYVAAVPRSGNEAERFAVLRWR